MVTGSRRRGGSSRPSPWLDRRPDLREDCGEERGRESRNGRRPERAREPVKRLGRLAQALLFVAVVLGVFGLVLPRVADFDEVWASIRSLTGWQYVVLVTATLWNIVTYWPVTMAGLPGLSFPQAAVVNQSSTSVAMTVPGGGAVAVGVTYTMFRSWGFRRSEIAMQALVTGIWNIGIRLALPVFALVILAVHGDQSGPLVTSAIVGVAILMRSEEHTSELQSRENL